MSSSSSARPTGSFSSARLTGSLATSPIRELAVDIINGEPIIPDRLQPDRFAKTLYGDSSQRNVKRLVMALRGELLDQMGGSAAGWEEVTMQYKGKRERSMVLQILSGLPEEERRRGEKRKNVEGAGRKRRKAEGKWEVPVEVLPQSNHDDDEWAGTGAEAKVEEKQEEKGNTPDKGKRESNPQGAIRKKIETPGSEQEATGTQAVQKPTRAQREQMRNDYGEMMEQMLLDGGPEHQGRRPPPKRLVLIILSLCRPWGVYVLRSQTPCSTAKASDDSPAIPAAVSDDAPVVSDLYPEPAPPAKRKRTAPPTSPSPPQPRNYPRRSSRTTSTSTPTPSTTPQPLPWLTPPATPPSSSLKSFHTALRSLSSALNIAVESMPAQWQEALVYETRHAWPLEPTLRFLCGVVQDSLNGVAVKRSIGRRTPPKMPVDVQEEDLRDYGTLQRFAELVGEMETVVEAVMDLDGEWVRRVEGLGVDRGWRLEEMAAMVMGVVASRTYGGVWGWAWKGLEGEGAG